PITGLYVTVQAEIIDLMSELCAAKGTAILMISHDLGLVANMCKRVAVMYAGRIVESQVAEAIFATPRHPYTQGLMDSLPRLGERSRHGRQRLREISGVVPSTEGGIALAGRDLKARARLETARTVQMVFQDPYASLNPRQTVRRTLADPLRLQGVTNKTEVEQRVMDMLAKVGLRPEHAD